jgi:hypothetical protein
MHIYYYGWDALRYGNLKWVHLTLGLLLNGVGLTLMVVANSWATQHNQGGASVHAAQRCRDRQGAV